MHQSCRITNRWNISAKEIGIGTLRIVLYSVSVICMKMAKQKTSEKDVTWRVELMKEVNNEG